MNLREFLKTYGLMAACLVSIIATSGSLYFSEIMSYEPCKLCWLQRICMYPLVVILGYSVISDNKTYARTAYPLAIVGLGIAVYHYLGQKVTFVPLSCQYGVPCNVDYINWFGFITIPFLSLIAFSLIIIFLGKSNKGNRIK
ncbi:disulfide oxidoreductase [Paenibacillus periandrae]|uniref:disulfide oxidoreductase n=1 Tax=Paenibacillus periandrae TaxID=1761741 RepID=UPI001F09C322|nr:disulfide oxidoreductase [Paenibacillus periandrae]